MSKNRLLISLRSYLTGDNLDELELQVREAKQHFPEAQILVPLCGEPASKYVEKQAEVIHYGAKPLGLTPPLSMAIEYAKDNNFEQLILTDGDSQFPFADIRRLYAWGLKNNSSAIIPVRRNKSLFFSDDKKADRVRMEERENALMRAKYPDAPPDPQPGLVLLFNNAAISALDLRKIPSMIGDLAITAQLLDAKMRIDSPEVDTRTQNKTRVSLKLEQTKLAQLEHFFVVNQSQAGKETVFKQ